MRKINIVGVAWMLAFVCANTGLAGVPNPTVIGPIPATAPPGDPSHNYPFFSTTVDLAAYDYVEEEFFLEGTANRYTTPPLTTGSVIDSGHTYTARIIVRRPASSDDFNGTVLMEWQFGPRPWKNAFAEYGGPISAVRLRQVCELIQALRPGSFAAAVRHQ